MAISEQFKLLDLNKKWEQEETNEKKLLLQFDKTYFLYCSFLTALLAFHFKGELYSLKRRSCNILNHSKWRRIEKDLPKCPVIGISTLQHSKQV
jgi:hypothetical protein